MSKYNITKGTLNSAIMEPEAVARRISQMLDPRISPTAIPSSFLFKAVKSAVNSGMLVPNPTIKMPIIIINRRTSENSMNRKWKMCK